MNTENKTASAAEGSILTHITDKAVKSQMSRKIFNTLTLDKNYQDLINLIHTVNKFIGPLEDVDCRVEEYEDDIVVVVFENPWK